MKFSGPDLMLSQFEGGVILVSRNVFPRDALTRAASRLLDSWPMLSFRTDPIRGTAIESPAEDIADGFLIIHDVDRQLPVECAGMTVAHGIKVYDGHVLNDFFSKKAGSWTDLFRPRIFAIQVALLRDATVFKFMIQHVAGDALGLHNAITAFCEALRGDVETRPPARDRQYKLLPHIGAGHKQEVQRHVREGCSRLQTSQAREWQQACTGNPLFPLMTLANKWIDATRVATKWQMAHFPEPVIDDWRAAAREAGAEVSTFNLFAAWIHLNLAAFGHDLDPSVPERLAFVVSVREFLESSQKPGSEFGNPISIAFAAPCPQSTASKRNKLVQGALQIRKHVQEVRDPAYMHDYVSMMDQAPRRQLQVRGMGVRVPATLLLTSWSHTPFPEVEVWSAPEQHAREPLIIQPVVTGLPVLPFPNRYVQDRQCAVVWRGRKGDGIWFAANLEADLWRRILDLSF